MVQFSGVRSATKYIEPAERILGDPIKISHIKKKCKYKKCSTILNSYRSAAGNKYCSVHSYIEINKLDIIQMKKLMEASKKAKERYKK